MTVAMTSGDSWPLCQPRFGTPRRPERKTRGAEVGLVAASIGKPLMPWQQHVADVALEIDPRTGRFAYREIVLTVPRRSGKSTLLLALLIHRMIAMGRPQVAAFTMQNALQARMRMRREWHAEILSRSPAMEKAYSFTGQPGAEALMFHNGSRIEVTASTASSGHGATLDLAVVDEAFDQPDDRLEQAFRPAIRTQPDAQLWWVSTAGGPSNKWFRSKVEAGRALCGDSSGTAIFEWSAPDDADASDPAVWWECMPALGFTRPDGSGLTEVDIAEDYRAMSLTNENGFRRAYLNQWREEVAVAGLDVDRWAGLVADAERGTPVFGLDLDTDRRAVVAVAWQRPDGGTQLSLSPEHLEVPAHEAVAACKALTDRWGGRVWLGGAAAGLAPDLEREHVPFEVLKAGQFPAACGLLVDGIAAGTVRHFGQPELDASVAGVVWRSRGTAGEREFDLTRSSNVGPVAAVTRALFGASQTADLWAGVF